MKTIPMLHTIWRVARAGLIAAALVAVAGWTIGRTRFGATDEDAIARIESDLRRQFAANAETLGRIAARVVADRFATENSPRGQITVRRLFDTLDAALPDQEADRTGITVYDKSDAPLAWAGRTWDLPKARLDGPATLFVSPGALGPRLVRIEPIVDKGRPTPARLATVVVERQLGPVRTTPGLADTFVIATALAPASLRVRVGDVSPPGLPGAYTFVIPAAGGGPLVDVEVLPADLAAARTRWRDRTWAAALAVVSLTLLLCAGPLLERRRQARSTRAFVATTIGLAAAIIGARLVFWFATSSLLGPQPWIPPLDLFLTALSLAVLVWLALDTVERWRVAGPRPPLLLGRLESIVWLGLSYAAAGIFAALTLWAYERFLRRVASQTTLDLVQFSLHPLTATRIPLAFALLLLHAGAIWTAITATRLPNLWRTRRANGRMLAPIAWLAGILVTAGVVRTADPTLSMTAFLIALTAVATGAAALAGLRRHARHASQAARLWALFLGLVVPAWAAYPSLLAAATEAKERLIATEYGPKALGLRENLQNALNTALEQIDAQPSLADLVVDSGEDTTPTTDRAVLVWSGTDLDTYRLSSAVELYGADGHLVSRFNLNLPEYSSVRHQSAGCTWDAPIAEVLPFGSSQRHVLRTSRGICEHGRHVGSIVVSVMLDYRTLPFGESQSPYLESLQPQRHLPEEGAFGRDIEFVTYGWSRAPMYPSGPAVWPLTDQVFQRLIETRSPFWSTVVRDGVAYRVYFTSDRGGIYALGYSATTWLKHLMNLAELAFLAGVLYALLVTAATLANALTSPRPTTGRALLREIRASFYRKLFLAFIAAAVLPVVILAIGTRTYFATELRGGVEEAAAKTVTVAQRLVEDYAALQQRGTGTRPQLDDQIMVLVQRAIDQDVNLFERAQLRATSERPLFASGLLPTRTPAEVYRRIVLDRLPTFVAQEEIGGLIYYVAAAPVRAGAREGIVTVPVPLQQNEIERQIDDLDRQVLSAAVLFSLLGAALGYWMAERIADPINRLTRATHRIARGNLDARVAAAASDELGRLIKDFNGMADDLKRQRTELERTQRLEAWADMARQVAHDIKNPLTPIQLSAEHARRVNIDRGKPLSPVLDDCVSAILSQVRLLRQIAAEFSSFASSTTPHPEETRIGALVEEVMAPYRSGLSGRIVLDVRIPDDLPLLNVDRTLLARAFTNVIENALHAMPGEGTLRIVVSRQSSVDSQRTSVESQQSTVNSQQSTVDGRQSTVDSRQSSDDGRQPSDDARQSSDDARQPSVDGRQSSGDEPRSSGDGPQSTPTSSSSVDIVVVEFSDTGIGMDAESMAKVFEPYFSTKAAGTGLGLTIAKRNVELNGGRIEVRSQKGLGTTVRMSFPTSSMS